jgi:resolvase-like protein
MFGAGRTASVRRVRLQSAAIVAAVGVVGVAFSVAGSPWWVAALYVVLALALGAVRLRIGRAPDARRAIGYVHTGDRRRDRSADVRRFCETRGLKLTAFVHDDGQQRPSLTWALAQLEADKADVLVVGRLQDLSSDVTSLAPLLKWFDGGHRTLIAIDLALDTSTEAGRLAASVVADVGAWDARPGHAAKPSLTLVQAAPEPPPPPPEPRAPAAPAPPPRPAAVADVPELRQRIRRMREQGMTLQAIADVLNAERVPTLRGGALWRPSSVQRATGYRRPSRGIEVDL